MTIHMDDKSEPEYRVILGDTRRMDMIDRLVQGDQSTIEKMSQLLADLTTPREKQHSL